jgi:uncharacterized membrane protein YqaE (UPF0057 family)
MNSRGGYVYVNSFQKSLLQKLPLRKPKSLKPNFMKKSLLFILLAVVFVFSSCKHMGNLQIEKRHYRNGYYVHHSGKSSENKTVAAVHETAVVENENVAAIKPEIVIEETLPVAETHATILPAKKDQATAQKKFEAAPQSRMTPADKKEKVAEKVRPVVSQLKQGSKPKQTPPADAGLNDVVMIILAIFLSPIAVYLKEGVTNRFWIDLICWLLGGGLVFSPFFYGGALLLFAIVFAVLIVFDVI